MDIYSRIFDCVPEEASEREAIVRIADILNTEFIPSSAVSGLYAYRKSIFPDKYGGSKFFSSGKGAKDKRYLSQHGSRKDIQFSIALEDGFFRYGLGLSLRAGQDVPSPLNELGVLLERFSRCYGLYHKKFPDMELLCFLGGKILSASGAVPEEWKREGNFIFWGRRVDAKASDIIWNDAVTAFDALYPIYQLCIESEPIPQPHLEAARGSYSRRSYRTGVPEVIVPGSLHNSNVDTYTPYLNQIIRRKLSQKLSGSDLIHNPSGIVADGCFYAIRYSEDALTAIKQSIGELLEYDGRLAVVSSAPFDDKAGEYLALLNRRYGLDITYRNMG